MILNGHPANYTTLTDATVLAADADLEYAMIDGTIVKVHRSGQGAKGGRIARPLAALAAA